MGFEIFGLRVFDLREAFGYFEAFSTIGVVCMIAFVCFLILAKNARIYKQSIKTSAQTRTNTSATNINTTNASDSAQSAPKAQ
ncbi:hypothetical protein BKN38_08925 [Helicobacter sp. CLO-3]|uniref:hypothetical protein n=1 Tax=unclassified Helicobacter TaxID=2593540 RepID=UPI0008055342|nr:MULTISPECIES: hypothetical protein [unclassified Helicobacter]OBV28848.1 hypothetical protein BA723_07905 [Helicobacter sp. CLO-3]OHU81485.1 hypothetical protein BKN38_08925 [Helicobacter sp. CLO-3]